MFAKYLLIFFVSMVPLVELRGSIVMAVGMDLDYWTSLAVCVVGNMLPVPVIYFLARRVLVWGQDKPVRGTRKAPPQSPPIRVAQDRHHVRPGFLPTHP